MDDGRALAGPRSFLFGSKGLESKYAMGFGTSSTAIILSRLQTQACLKGRPSWFLLPPEPVYGEAAGWSTGPMFSIRQTCHPYRNHRRLETKRY